MPVRGKASKTVVRVDANPVARPCQYGEFADRARRSGRCTRSRLRSLTAARGSPIPTWTCVASVGSRRASTRMDAPMAR